MSQELPACAEPLDREGLLRLLATGPAPEDFGPFSTRPLLVVRRDAVGSESVAALQSLPCPVVGIGLDGPIEPFDLVVDQLTRLNTIAARIVAAPIAAMVLVQHLRASVGLPLFAALTAESMAYATLQAGPEFRQWLEKQGASVPADVRGQPLRVEHKDRTLHIAMNRPAQRNPIGVAMRDALCEAFDLATALDIDLDRVVLSGTGRFFSVGGDLREFGQVSDPATAHCIRSIRLPAARLLPVAHKLTVRIQGGAIGAGIEIAAFADHLVAQPNAWFQLPEIAFGLIPGAGGTVSIVRRIGRHRAAEMMLSGRRVRAVEALDWGLIDAIEI